MEKRKLEVTARHSFGRIDYLPANEAATDFCNLLGKPNLPLDAIIKLRQMGYEVEEVVKTTL